MKKYTFTVFVSILLQLISINVSFGKRGCCSKHGGVCGNRCCDGTSLSLKCSGSTSSYLPIKPQVDTNTSSYLPIKPQADTAAEEKKKVNFLDLIKINTLYMVDDSQPLILKIKHQGEKRIHEFSVEKDSYDEYIFIFKTEDGKESFTTFKDIENITEFQKIKIQ